jgi:hypothetical protein
LLLSIAGNNTQVDSVELRRAGTIHSMPNEPRTIEMASLIPAVLEAVIAAPIGASEYAKNKESSTFI